MPTPHGPVDVTWRRTADTFAATVDVPDGATAEATLPLPASDALLLVDGQLATGTVTIGPGTHDLVASTNWSFSPETGQYLAGAFKAFWDTSGGLPVFGYPLRGEQIELSSATGVPYPTQYFERQRFEYHIEFAGTPYEVLLGRLGADDARRRGLLATSAFQPLPADPGGGSAWFAEAKHSLSGEFLTYWNSHGLEFGDDGLSYRESLALFGYPISEPFVDAATRLSVQYFERARFGWHPEHVGTLYEVLLGRLGAELGGS